MDLAPLREMGGEERVKDASVVGVAQVEQLVRDYVVLLARW